MTATVAARLSTEMMDLEWRVHERWTETKPLMTTADAHALRDRKLRASRLLLHWALATAAANAASARDEAYARSQKAISEAAVHNAGVARAECDRLREQLFKAEAQIIDRRTERDEAQAALNKDRDFNATREQFLRSITGTVASLCSLMGIDPGEGDPSFYPFATFRPKGGLHDVWIRALMLKADVHALIRERDTLKLRVTPARAASLIRIVEHGPKAALSIVVGAEDGQEIALFTDKAAGEAFVAELRARIDAVIETEVTLRTSALQQDVAELQRSFDLRWAADHRAIARWRAENPEARELLMPDHADMVVWLLDLFCSETPVDRLLELESKASCHAAIVGAPDDATFLYLVALQNVAPSMLREIIALRRVALAADSLGAVGHAIAMRQPAVMAPDQATSDLWAAFYDGVRLLNDARRTSWRDDTTDVVDAPGWTIELPHMPADEVAVVGQCVAILEKAWETWTDEGRFHGSHAHIAVLRGQSWIAWLIGHHWQQAGRVYRGAYLSVRADLFKKLAAEEAHRG